MSWRRRAGRFIGALGLGVLLGVGWVAWRSVQLYLHPPRHLPQASPADYGIVYREVTLSTVDGVDLAAWYVPPRHGCVILQAHGYGSCRDAAVTARFAQAGYGVLAWDFRAHGASGGKSAPSAGWNSTMLRRPWPTSALSRRCAASAHGANPWVQWCSSVWPRAMRTCRPW